MPEETVPPADYSEAQPGPSTRPPPAKAHETVERPMIRIQVKNQIGEPRQVTMSGTLEPHPHPLTDDQERGIIAALREIFATFDAEITEVKLLTHHTLEI